MSVDHELFSAFNKIERFTASAAIDNKKRQTKMNTFLINFFMNLMI